MIDKSAAAVQPAQQAMRIGAGRPPRITRAQIAHAALEIGLDRATVRNVAERLEMSVPGLYHHVRTRDQLLDLAMEFVLTTVPPSWASDAPWSVKLLDYGRKMLDIFIEQPELIGHIASGAVVSIEYVLHLEAFLEGARVHGFEPIEGYEIQRTLMSTVIGAATIRAGDQAMTRAGRSITAKLDEIRQAQPAELLHDVGDLLERHGTIDLDPFEPVRMMVDVILARFGDGINGVVPDSCAS